MISASSLLSPRATSPYIIYVTHYTDMSSGVRALHLLCHALNRAGCEAYVTAGDTNPVLQTPPLLPPRREALRKAPRPPIVVYPEVIGGNPLESPVVVRWLLNQPGNFVDNWSGSYNPDDLIFYHDADFLVEGVRGTRMHLPACDASTFHNFENPDDGERKGWVLYMSRFLKTGEPVPDFLKDAVEVSPKNPKSAKELAALYRRSEMLFTFERTAAAVEAVMCGCPVIYLPSSIMPEMPLVNVWGTNGFGWGYTEDQVAHARATVGQFWDICQTKLRGFDQQLQNFIDITQARASQFAPPP